MVERVPSISRNMGGAPPVRERRGGGEGYPDFSRGREAGQGTQPGGPDLAQVQKLARELAAEFGREHIVENFRVKPTGPVSIARAVAVDAAPGSAPADGPERKISPRVLEAVETAPGRIHPQSFSISGDYRPASGGAPRGDILNFHA